MTHEQADGAYLPPEKLSNSDEKTPEPLFNVEGSAAERLPSPLHDHNLQRSQTQDVHLAPDGLKERWSDWV